MCVCGGGDQEAPQSAQEAMPHCCRRQYRRPGEGGKRAVCVYGGGGDQEAPNQLRRECHTAAGGNTGSLGKEVKGQYVCVWGGKGITRPLIRSGGVSAAGGNAVTSPHYRWGGQCGHQVSMFIYDCRQLDYCETSRAKPDPGSLPPYPGAAAAATAMAVPHTPPS